MITIPVGLWALTMVLSCFAGALGYKLADVSGSKHLRKVVDLTTRREATMIAERDELRMRLSAAARRADGECRRRRECETVIAKIRGLLPPECDMTFTAP